MTAAIYARKSTDQSGVGDEQRSVARQVEHARAYATRKGWRVLDEHVYVDDGISGAEFANRPGFLRLMNALKPRPPFQVLIMSEESRLGREAIETAYALKQLVQAGVRVFFYLEDRERTLDSPTDKIMLSLTAFADELEREKARQRTYDAMQRKARAGHVTGGRVFGYDNVEMLGADGQRSHVERRINEAEAAVVRRIFELCAAGAGLTRDHEDAQRRGRRRRRGRSRAAGGLGAERRSARCCTATLYRGVIVWNQTRKRDRWGQHQQHARPEAEWMRMPAPQLQIVSDELWRAAHAQMKTRRVQHSQPRQRPMDPIAGTRTLDVEPKYLLTGLGRCAVCGGGWLAHTRDHGPKRAKFYGCATHWKRGARVCGNGLVARVEAIDAEVLATLADDVLRPTVINQAIALALDELAPAGSDRTRRRLEDELEKVTAECGRLAEAIGRGGRLTALLDRLTRLEARADALRAELATCHAPAPTFDRTALERRLQAKLADWRGLLTRNIATGNAMLRMLLAEPIRFTPLVEERRRAYRFEGRIALDRMIAGLVPSHEIGAKLHQLMASLTIPSWNQLHEWLTAMQQLRDSSGFAA